jgi:putative DNA primase/helicase
MANDDWKKMLFEYTLNLKRLGLTRESAEKKYRERAEQEGLRGEEVDEIFNNAWNSELESNRRRFSFTDVGNAERLVARYGEKIRYCKDMGKWLIWDGVRWQVDDANQMIELAKETVRGIAREAPRNKDGERDERYRDHALASESEARLRAMIRLAQSDDKAGIVVPASKLDADPWLLNCLNGTIDLKTVDLLPHDPAHFITKVIPFEFYNHHPRPPAWMRFLERIMGGEHRLVYFLQRCIGYVLTGDTSEQCFFLLYGKGANGKSVFLEVIRSLLGEDYARQADLSTFLSRQHTGIPNDLARFKGVRFVSGTEMDEGKRLYEPLVKLVSGGDTITARFLYKEFFEFVPSFKLFIATNHKPNVVGVDHAIWRRIKLIPFPVTIPEHEQDRDLLRKLKAELPSILTWAVWGCRRWRRGGLRFPDQVVQATRGYREESDVVGRFIEECCEIGHGQRATVKELYEAFVKRHGEEGDRPMNSSQFGQRMAAKGFDRWRTGSSRGFEGIAVRKTDP